MENRVHNKTHNLAQKQNQSRIWIYAAREEDYFPERAAAVEAVELPKLDWFRLGDSLKRADAAMRFCCDSIEMI